MTPPQYWQPEDTAWGRTEREAWDWFEQEVEARGPFDIALLNGDLIAGDNRKQAGGQLIDTSQLEQCEMFMPIMDLLDVKTVGIARGTFYHVSSGANNFENVIANYLKERGCEVEIKNHLFTVINGRAISLRHRMGTSAKEELRGTPLLNQGRANEQWYLRGKEPLADIVLRAHTHGEMLVKTKGKYYVNMPPLQAMGDDWASRVPDGTVSFGFTEFTISRKGNMMVDTVIGDTCFTVEKPWEPFK